jgi:hypothetical protein
MNIPETEIRAPIAQFRRHYAVDIGGRGKILPVRKTEVTTRLIAECAPVVVDVPTGHGPRRIQCYVATGAIAALLDPYVDSKKLRRAST